MNSILVAIALLICGTVQAATPGYEAVPAEKVGLYKKALSKAMHENTDAHYGCHYDWVSSTFHRSTEILVSTTKEQPLVLLNSYSHNGFQMDRMVFFTTADLKSLTKVHAEVYHLGEVNNGDLANPIIVQDYVIQSRSDCSLQ